MEIAIIINYFFCIVPISNQIDIFKNHNHHFSSFSDNKNQTVSSNSSDDISVETLKQLRWVIAGVTFGIFVIVTVGIALSHYIATKRVERKR